MKRNTKKFLAISFSLLAIACVVMITFTSSVIAEKSDFAINKIGSLYMSGMAKQMQEKFDTVIDMQISELKGIVERHPPESVVYDQDMFDQLALSAQVRDFVYLGLYTEEGRARRFMDRMWNMTVRSHFGVCWMTAVCAYSPARARTGRK